MIRQLLSPLLAVRVTQYFNFKPLHAQPVREGIEGYLSRLSAMSVLAWIYMHEKPFSQWWGKEVVNILVLCVLGEWGLWIVINI